MKKHVILFAFFMIATLAIYAQNVGIGTATPLDKLSVQTSLPGYGFTHTYGGVTVGSYVNSLTGQIGTKSNNPLQFFTANGNAQVTLLQNGNFGIGTIFPLAALNVVGSVLTEGGVAGVRFNDRVDNTKGYQWYANTGNAYLYRHQGPAANAIAVLANGNVGLNVDNPQSDLHINPMGAGSILLGTNKSSGGYTVLEMGISAASNGYGFIQATKAAGSSYGNLLLSPYGGNVQVNFPTNSGSIFPLDINQSDENHGLRLRNNVGNYQHDWDIFSSINTHALGLFFAFNLAATSWIVANDGSYNSISDERFKKNIHNMDHIMDKVMLLQPKNYEFKANNPDHKISTGFIAQEVSAIFPDLVSSFQHPAKDLNDTSTYYGLNYAGFGVIAIKAIQEQQKEINDLKKVVAELKGLVSKQ